MTVVAAAVERDGRVLVVRRAPGQKLEGKWEFPGGKVEAGESEQAALEREMLEELGVYGTAGDFVGESAFAYAFGEVRLKLYRFNWLSGEMTLTVHDQLDWVTPEALPYVDFAPADVPLAGRLRALILGLGTPGDT
jgi:8-oxo-dGTP diphosphatase